MSVDGYIADSEGGVDWLDAYHFEGFDFNAFLDQIDTIVMGRTTYDQVLTFGSWPYPGKKVIVISSSTDAIQSPETTVWSKSIADLVTLLRNRLVEKDVWILGGGKALKGFREADAVDSYELYVMPIVLGGGVPLFLDTTFKEALTLVSSQTFENGVVELIYT